MGRKFIRTKLAAAAIVFIFAGSVGVAQEKTQITGLKFTPDSLNMEIGDTVTVRVQAVDANGNVVKAPFLLYSRGRYGNRRGLSVKPRSSGPDGDVVAKVVAHFPGDFTLNARTIAGRDERINGSIPAIVPFPPLKRIVFVDPIKKIYQGTTVSFNTAVFDAAGLERPDTKTHYSSSEPTKASVDHHGTLIAHQQGRLKIVAHAEGLEQAHWIEIFENPVKSVVLKSSVETARTGDVIHFTAAARNALGQDVTDAPISFSVSVKPDDGLGQSSTGQIKDDGRFVAESPGLYTIIAHSGSSVAQKTIRIDARNVGADIELVGHGLVPDVFTSDLWVWEGIDGRDYAVTGTWGGNGDTYFWDVTDPTNIVSIDTVNVDARTINDVKISEDGRIGVISREGASNRKNGFVVLDVSNPRDVKILSRYDDQLTGGVHNVFIYENHVYAVNNGRKYDVINIEDPRKPYRVSVFELGTPGHSIHDVWIEDGIAYSSNWADGIQLVDVGGATSGAPFRSFGEGPSTDVNVPNFGSGSPESPKQFASYAYPSGWNHAAFPFRSESAGKFYVLAGDEAFPWGLNTNELKPTLARGWIHFIDFTDPKKPDEIARYQVPEAGSHNYWVENDTLYAAFYNGGLRVVDVSGELMGDLYKQGREIGWFLPMHKQGHIANASMVWGPMPHKGIIYFSDHNSGLWAVKVVKKKGKK